MSSPFFLFQDTEFPGAGAAVTDTINDNTNNNSNGVDEEEGLESPPPPLTRRQSSLRVATGRLDYAMARAMEAYQKARLEVLYGLNEHGRPLEEAGQDRSSDRM